MCLRNQLLRINGFPLPSSYQSIKLLGAEKGKKNKTNVYFLAGKRVLSYLGKCLTNEKLLTGHLK